MRFDQAGQFKYINPAQTRLFGMMLHDIIGKNFWELPGWEEKEEIKIIDKQFKNIINDRSEHIVEFQTMTPKGLRWVQNHGVPEFAEDGSIISVLLITRDITEQKQLEERLRYLTIHDTLTRLYNRTFFEETLNHLDHGREFPVSIIMVDIDDLKMTNDRLGHNAGDKLLRSAAEALRGAFRKEDVVARIGGDEFAVLLPRTNKKVAKEAVKRVRKLLQKQNAAVNINPIELSFGISTDERGASLTDVLKRADEMMYSEKQTHDEAEKRSLMPRD